MAITAFLKVGSSGFSLVERKRAESTMREKMASEELGN
jgi:hypothetical protein